MSRQKPMLGGIDAHGLVNLIRWAPPADVVDRTSRATGYSITTGRHFVVASQSERQRGGRTEYSVKYQRRGRLSGDWDTVFNTVGDTSVSARAIFEALEARFVAQGRPQFVPEPPELNRRDIVRDRIARKLS